MTVTVKVKCEERDIKQCYMDKINTLTKQLHPAIEEDSAHDINYVVKTLNRRWQDTSDKLDQCRDLGRPLFHEDCWLVAYIKNSLTTDKRPQEVHFKYTVLIMADKCTRTRSTSL
ncbi:uncharacterized protein LOC116308712 [Actinia tenebrosa]|uniref:Uncharacterized protein LOC116308712 n=1 Tax=Actinia tenebrosa TaxID=6105 RepID=A0A6P8J5Q7_ACTTE|nr:uncharacterized protein LOC116308712 [Actinia tenebrosa]